MRSSLVQIVMVIAIVANGSVRAQTTDDLGALNARVMNLYSQGKYNEATEVAKLSLALAEKKLGPDHTDVGRALNSLALLYFAGGKYAEAEPLVKRSLGIRERTLGPNHPDVGQSLNNLAELYRLQQRHADAEPLYQRALTIRENALGTNHPDVGTVLNNLASLHYAQGRYAEAEPLYKRALTIRDRALGAEHPATGNTANNLAEVYVALGRYAEAEPLHKRSLALREKALGADHPDIAQSLNNIATLHYNQGRFAEAEPLYQRALAIFEKTLGFDHPNVGTMLNNLAGVYFWQRDWRRAADYWRRSTSLLVRRAQRGTDDVGQALIGKRKGEVAQESGQFWALIKVEHRLVLEGRSAHAGSAREMFQTAQWAQASEAAQSITQMAARGAKREPALAALVRERQDLVAEWQKRDGAHSATVSQPPDKRDRTAEAANVARLAEIDTRIAAIDARLEAEFPDYAALARPAPLSIPEVQAQLGSDEALVLFLDTPDRQPTPEETFIWVVTKTEMRWVRSDVGTKGLADHVAALRCGLDATLWDDTTGPETTEEQARQRAEQIARRQRCEALVKAKPATTLVGLLPIEVLPFDVDRAHALYKALFGQVEDLIAGKHRQDPGRHLRCVQGQAL